MERKIEDIQNQSREISLEARYSVKDDQSVTDEISVENYDFNKKDKAFVHYQEDQSEREPEDNYSISGGNEFINNLYQEVNLVLNRDSVVNRIVD